MCEIGGMSPRDYLAFLRERAVKRRKEDAAREGVESNDPKRPGAQWRIYSTLAYAISFEGKRYAGYSGTPGGMSRQNEEDKSNIFLETDQAKRRIKRLEGIDPGKSFDPKKVGVPGLSGSSRPYCRCAEPAALSIAISKGETVDNLVFCAFHTPKFDNKAPDCVFSPCPNCSSWLNRFAGGYFTRKTDQDKLLKQGTETLAAKHMTPDTGRNRARRNSCEFIINPPRKVKDITFDLDGEVYVLRCFKGAA